MRRLLTWLGLGAGALFFLRGRRRRSEAEAVAADPATELRQKLADSRGEDEAPPAPEPAAEPPAGLDERRREVHTRARITIDEMLGGENLPGEETD
ncbi:MAG TPA: hypothetical protein VFB35_01670 [Gaiellaceae bacterium]|nr:hypothetical protein [Gaiellaceae bacterium]